jgi:hypothetical protein
MIVAVRRRVASTVAGEIGCDDGKIVSQKRSYIAPHQTRFGEAVEQEHSRAGSPRLNEDRPAIGFDPSSFEAVYVHVTNHHLREKHQREGIHVRRMSAASVPSATSRRPAWVGRCRNGCPISTSAFPRRPPSSRHSAFGQKPTQPDPIADPFHAQVPTGKHGTEYDLVWGRVDVLRKAAVKARSAPQNTLCSGAHAVQRFWYGWKMWSFAFTATWHACPQSEGLGSAMNLSDAAS